MTGDDAASLTALLREYGGPLCEITRTPQGYKASRRYPHAAAVVFTAPTVPALRELLEHGYDPASSPPSTVTSAASGRSEHITPGSAWIALSRGDDGLIQVIAANDLGTLRSSLGRSPDEVPGAATGQRRSSITPGPDS